MTQNELFTFSAQLDIIGINPFVFVPVDILEKIFAQAKNDKGAIPVKGTINSLPYQQTLVKYKGDWRLYVNLKMLKNSTKRIGETLDIAIVFDPKDRSLTLHPKLKIAFAENDEARKVFNNLTHSKQQEIIRYISRLKTSDSITKNIQRAINFLQGKERFLGREKP